MYQFFENKIYNVKVYFKWKSIMGVMYLATGNMECKRVEGFKACLDVRANQYIHNHADAKVKCPKICSWL